MAEEVSDKTRGNFCDWFLPRANAFTPESPPQADARHALDTLFGAPERAPPASAPDALRRLFGD